MDQGGLAHTYDPGALKITVSKFYRPSGASTQLHGVSADIILPSTSDFSDVSESTMKDPLPWDAVAPAHYDYLNRVEPYIGALRDKFASRIKGEKEFTHLAEAIAQLKKSLATKSVSLNESERRKELAQSNARQTELERESEAHRASRPTVYDITLKNAATPGLPLPTAFVDNSHTTDTKTSSLAGDRRGNGSHHKSFATDIILNESVRILADYVNLMHQS
jgi:carboxyl-terminal processing protease